MNGNCRTTDRFYTRYTSASDVEQQQPEELTRDMRVRAGCGGADRGNKEALHSSVNATSPQTSVIHHYQCVIHHKCYTPHQNRGTASLHLCQYSLGTVSMVHAEAQNSGLKAVPQIQDPRLGTTSTAVNKASSVGCGGRNILPSA